MRWDPNKKTSRWQCIFIYRLILVGVGTHCFTILYWFSITTIKNPIVPNQTKPEVPHQSYFFTWVSFSNRKKGLFAYIVLLYINVYDVVYMYIYIISYIVKGHEGHMFWWLTSTAISQQPKALNRSAALRCAFWQSHRRRLFHNEHLQ